MLKDISSSAVALYDGGWRSTDADQLRTEYDLTEEETQELCAALVDLEEKINDIHPAHAGGAFLLPCIDTVQGFYFALLQYSHIQAFTARFAVSIQLYRPRHKTSHRALQGLFLQLHPFHRPRYQTDTRGYNTTCATLERITTPQRLQHIPQIPTPRRTLYRPAQPPYYNKVYKGAGVRHRYGSTPDSAAHRRPSKPGGAVQ